MSIFSRALQSAGELLISLGAGRPSPPRGAAPSPQHSQFNDKSRTLIDKRGGSAPVLAGAIQLIGLNEQKKALGPAWATIAQEAYEIVDKIIRERLSDADICTQYDDDTYIICFADVDRATSERKAKAIAEDIRMALLAAASEAKHLGVSHAVTELQHEDVLMVDVSPLEAVAAALRKVRQDAEEAQQGWRRALIRDANIVYTPIWNVKSRAVLLYRCLLDDLTGKTALRRFARLSDPDELRSTLADLDGIIFGRAVSTLHELLHQQESLVLVIPVHFHTLNEKQFRDSYLALCKDVPPSYRQFILPEIHGIPNGVPVSRVLQLSNQLKAYSRAIIIETPPDDWYISQLGASGIFGVCLSLDRASDATFAIRLSRCVSAVKSDSRCTMVHGADTIGLAQMAVKAGIDHISGRAIAPSVERPKGAYHLNAPFAMDTSEH